QGLQRLRLTVMLPGGGPATRSRPGEGCRGRMAAVRATPPSHGEPPPVAGCLHQQAMTGVPVGDTLPLRRVRVGGVAAPRGFKDAADDYVDAPTGKRPEPPD